MTGWRMVRVPWGKLRVRWVRKPVFAPLVSTPTITLSAAVAACVASAYGRVRPRIVDPDEATVVARFDRRSVAR